MKYDKRIRLIEREVWLRDGHTCQDCKKTDVKLVLHHIPGELVSLKKDDRYEDCVNSVNDMVVLCYPCHIKRHWRTWGRKKENKQYQLV